MHTHTHMHAHADTWIQTHAHAHAHAYTYTHAHAHSHRDTLAHTNIPPPLVKLRLCLPGSLCPLPLLRISLSHKPLADLEGH